MSFRVEVLSLLQGISVGVILNFMLEVTVGVGCYYCMSGRSGVSL